MLNKIQEIIQKTGSFDAALEKIQHQYLCMLDDPEMIKDPELHTSALTHFSKQGSALIDYGIETHQTENGMCDINTALDWWAESFPDGLQWNDYYALYHDVFKKAERLLDIGTIQSLDSCFILLENISLRLPIPEKDNGEEDFIIHMVQHNEDMPSMDVMALAQGLSQENEKTFVNAAMYHYAVRLQKVASTIPGTDSADIIENAHFLNELHYDIPNPKLAHTLDNLVTYCLKTENVNKLCDVTRALCQKIDYAHGHTDTDDNEQTDANDYEHANDNDSYDDEISSYTKTYVFNHYEPIVGHMVSRLIGIHDEYALNTAKEAIETLLDADYRHYYQEKDGKKRLKHYLNEQTRLQNKMTLFWEEKCNTSQNRSRPFGPNAHQ